MPTTPRALYRGWGMNVSSIAPVTMVQFGTTRLLEGAMLAVLGGDGELTTAQRLVATAGAGCAVHQSCEVHQGD